MDAYGFLSVSDINGYLKQMCLNDENLRGIFVKGEISNFLDHPKLGHLYFTLKDETCAIKAVMFKGSKWRIKFKPQNGMKVILFGNINVFERDGIFQIIAEDMQPDGVGALHIAYEQLKEKLAKKGYFAPKHKKPIPNLPKRIGVITAKSGAAVQDILNIIGRRYPLAHVVVIDCLVQGAGAAPNLCRAVKLAQTLSLDTLIIGRGGGSLEDLWAFNDENLAKAIYDCPVPVISAVGHETDYTISDFVADLRAPTPSAAAELAVPDLRQIRQYIDNRKNLLYNNILGQLNQGEKHIQQLGARLSAYSPESFIKTREELLAGLYKRLVQFQLSGMALLTQRFSHAVSSLETLSPLNTIARGYSITYREDGSILKNARGIKPGAVLITRVKDASVTSRVESVNRDSASQNGNIES